MEESEIAYKILSFLKEQNINYWSSIAQIVTSIVLVIAAIWTARIHHKNRKDQNNLKKAPLKVLLHSSAVKKESTISESNMTGMVPIERIDGKIRYNIRFISENTGAFHLIDVKLFCVLPVTTQKNDSASMDRVLPLVHRGLTVQVHAVHFELAPLFVYFQTTSLQYLFRG